MKTIKIFLASSEELKQERLELADLVENLNLRLNALGLHIQLVKWEYLDASMGPEHKQEEYNEALRDCEMCLVLYWRRFGDYTTIELDTAYQGLCAGRNPKKLYVYFKDVPELSPEIVAFRDSFPEKYGHFYSHFQNIDTLKAEFLLQFIDYQKNYLQSSNLVEVKDGQVQIGGKVYVDLKNVPFAGNNEEYNLLLKSIKKTQKLLSVTDPDDPEHREYAIELAELKERQKQMENSLWDTALMITQLSTTQCSERLKRAMDLFAQGDNKGALAVLNEEEIDRDINHNLQLIQLGEEGKKGLAINIDEMLFKIKALETERKEKWFEEVDRLYSKCLEIGRGILDEQKTCEILFDYGLFLQNQNQFTQSEDFYKETLEIRKRLAVGNPQVYEPYVADTLNNLANLYTHTQRLDESEEMYKEALEIYKRLAEGNPQAYYPDVATTLNNLALLYSNTQRLDESEEMLKEALELYKRLAEGNPQAYEPDVAMTLNGLANLYYKTQRLDESEQLHMEALELYKRLAEGNPQAYEPDVATTLNNLAILYADTQRLDESEEMYKEALEICRRLAEGNPQAYEPDVASILGCWAFLKNELGQFNEAEQMSMEALGIDASQHFIYTNLAAALLLQGKYEEAEAIYQEYKDEMRDDFIADFEQFDTLGVIPEERKADVERIKRMLMME